MKFVTTTATIECGHGGKATLKPGGTGLSIDGNQLVSVETLPGTPICGCTQIGPGLVPCTLITSVIQGASPGIKSNGQTPLLDIGGGLTNGSPPGFWSVSDPGQKKADESPASPAPAPATTIRETVPPTPGVKVRAAAWQSPTAKVGQSVGLTAKYTGPADGQIATFRVYELLKDKKKRPLGECSSDPAAGGTLTAKWVAIYPPDPDWNQFAAKGRKLPQLAFTVELAGVATETTKPLQLSADLTVRVEDPFGQPLADEPFVVRCADGTWIRGKKTNRDGWIKCSGIHPGPPLVYLPNNGPQYVAADPPPQRSGLDQVERLATVARDRLRRLREAAIDPATEKWLTRLESDVDKVCVAIPKERKATPQTASAAVLSIGLPLSATTSEVPPVAVILAVGTFLAAGLMWLSQQQWRSPEMQSATSRLKESTKPTPNAQLPSNEQPTGGPRRSKPTIAEAIGPTIVIAASLAERQQKKAEQVPLYWPTDHLPWPPGCDQGSILTRFVGKTRTKRKTTGAQAFVNELISDAEQAGVSIPEYSRQPFLEDYSKRYPGDADRVAHGFRIPIATTPCVRRTEVHDFYIGGGTLRHFHAHHTLPLYFAGGEDVLDNICIMQADCHLRGHVLLRYQEHWKEHGLPKDILKHPPGTLYELIASPERDLFVPERDPEPDDEEDDYLVGLYHDR